MLYNQHVSKMMERQQTRKTRQIYHALAELNIELNQLHKSIERIIDQEKYKYVTEYVNQYVSYTTVWNLKFVYNLENPEVALLQIFHLNYILEREDSNFFEAERLKLHSLAEQFENMNPFSKEKVEERYQKMLQFIQEKSSTSLENTEQ